MIALLQLNDCSTSLSDWIRHMDVLLLSDMHTLLQDAGYQQLTNP